MLRLSCEDSRLVPNFRVNSSNRTRDGASDRIEPTSPSWSRTGPLRCFGSPLRIGLLQIDSQSALHIGVGAGVGAVALTLGIVGPERRLRRRLRTGAPSQRECGCGHERDTDHTEAPRRPAVAMAARQKLGAGPLRNRRDRQLRRLVGSHCHLEDEIRAGQRDRVRADQGCDYRAAEIQRIAENAPYWSDMNTQNRVPAQASLRGRPPDASIQNDSGLPQGPAGRFRGILCPL